MCLYARVEASALGRDGECPEIKCPLFKNVVQGCSIIYEGFYS